MAKRSIEQLEEMARIAERRAKEARAQLKRATQAEEARQRAQHTKELYKVAELYGCSVPELLRYIKSDKQVHYFREHKDNYRFSKGVQGDTPAERRPFAEKV